MDFVFYFCLLVCWNHSNGHGQRLRLDRISCFLINKSISLQLMTLPRELLIGFSRTSLETMGGFMLAPVKTSFRSRATVLLRGEYIWIIHVIQILLQFMVVQQRQVSEQFFFFNLCRRIVLTLFSCLCTWLIFSWLCHCDINLWEASYLQIYLVAENRVLKIYPLRIGTSEGAVEVFFGQWHGTEGAGEIIGISASISTSCVLITVKNRGLFAYRLHGQLLWSAGPVLYQHGYRQGCRKNITGCYFTSPPVIDQCEASIFVSSINHSSSFLFFFFLDLVFFLSKHDLSWRSLILWGRYIRYRFVVLILSGSRILAHLEVDL